MKGLFISFDGGDGTGKSTQSVLLNDWMQNRGMACVLTKEPGTPYIEECKAIREILLNPKNNLSNRAELLLFLADRAQHVDELIRPELEKGKNVICDRFMDSTRVYQNIRGFSRDKIDMMLEFSTGGLVPDITFILDLSVEVSLERAKAKSIYKEGDRIEKAGTKFHEDVRYGFLKLAESITEQRRFHVIDASPPKTIEQIHEEIVRVVSKKIWVSVEEKNG